MVIGFSQRRQTVSESDAPPQQDSFDLTLNVHSLRLSELEYEIQFRALRTGTAHVESIDFENITRVDALFGTRADRADPLVDSQNLTISTLEVSTVTKIIQDFSPELLECYTIRILSPDIARDRDIFTCFEDEDNEMDFFCLQTVCIEDDDG